MSAEPPTLSTDDTSAGQRGDLLVGGILAAEDGPRVVLPLQRGLELVIGRVEIGQRLRGNGPAVGRYLVFTQGPVVQAALLGPGPSAAGQLDDRACSESGRSVYQQALFS